MPEKIIPCEGKMDGGTRGSRQRRRGTDCVEPIRLHPSRTSQYAIEEASEIRAGKAELLGAAADMRLTDAKRCLFWTDLRFFYRVTADAVLRSGLTAEITGLAVFSRRTIHTEGAQGRNFPGCFFPERKDAERGGSGAGIHRPVILGFRLTDGGGGSGDAAELRLFPPCLFDSFEDNLYFGNEGRRAYVTLRLYSSAGPGKRRKVPGRLKLRSGNEIKCVPNSGNP